MIVIYLFLISISSNSEFLFRPKMALTTPILHQNHHTPFSLISKTSLFPLPLRKSSLSFTTSSTSFSSSSSSSPRVLHVSQVSTVPVEYEPQSPDYGFEQEIIRLTTLRSKLSDLKSFGEKLKLIDRDSKVKEFFNSRRNWFSRVLPSLNLDSYELFLLKCLVASGQEHVLSLGMEFVESDSESARGLVKHALYSLVEMIEKFDGTGNGNGNGNAIT